MSRRHILVISDNYPIQLDFGMKLLLQFLIFTFILILNFYSELKSQLTTLPNQKYSSYSGRHFYLAFMENEIDEPFDNNDLHLYLYLASDKDNKINIKFDSISIDTIVKANTITKIIIPYWMELRYHKKSTTQNSEIPINKSIEINAIEPITTYAFSNRFTTSDMSIIIPTNYWGKEYFIASSGIDYYHLDFIPDSLNVTLKKSRNGEFVVIAKEDSTIITINLKTNSIGSLLQNLDYQILLNKGECFFVLGKQSLKLDSFDLTGSRITSNKDIGVISGHVRTAIQDSMNKNSASKNHLFEMLPPTKAWGNKYLTIPFENNLIPESYKLIAKDSNTVYYIQLIDLDIVLQDTLKNPGDYVSIKNVTSPITWETNHPTMLAQFWNSYNNKTTFNLYDPSLNIVSPISQTISTTLIQIPESKIWFSDTTHQDFYSGVLILADLNARNDLTINGSSFSFQFPFKPISTVIGDFYYSFAYLPSGNFRFTSQTGKFNGYMFGNSAADAFLTNLGANLSDPNLVDKYPPKLTYTDNCDTVDIFVNDKTNLTDLGIFDIETYGNLNKNAAIIKSKIEDTSYFAQIRVYPLDRTKDANLTIIAVDKGGNRVQYEYQYFATEIEFTKNIIFSNIKLNSVYNRTITLTNKSKKSIKIDSIYKGSDGRLFVQSQSSLPFTLGPDESTSIYLTFTSDDRSDSLFQELKVFFACDISKSISVIGNINKPSLYTEDIYFPKTRVFDTSRKEIFWINTGNLDLNIDSISYNQFAGAYNYFKINNLETKDLTNLPDSLFVGDTLKISFCEFVPDIDGNFNGDFTLFTRPSASNNAKVFGIGGSPQILPLKIDLGPHRIGLSQDSVISVQNVGTFKGMALKLDDLTNRENQIRDSLSSIINIDILEKDSIKLNFKYNPILNKDYLLYSGEYIIDWKGHSKVNVEVLGHGTIPQIKTQNYFLDTLYVNESAFYKETLIWSFGNEKLSIDSIVVLENSNNSFELMDFNFNNQILDSNETYEGQITFKPIVVGEQFLKLIVYHDAAPAFQRLTDTITIRAFARALDIVDVLPKINISDFQMCSDNNIELKIENNGNNSIFLDSFLIVEKNISKNISNIALDSILNYEVKTGKFESLNLKYLANNIDIENLLFKLKFKYFSQFWKDSILEINQQINFVKKNIVIDSIQSVKFVIGDTSNMFFDVVFSQGNDIPINTSDLKITIKTKGEGFSLNNPTFESYLISSSNQKINLSGKVSQKNDLIKLEFDSKEILIQSGDKLRFVLNFLKLLSPELKPKFEVNITESNCYFATDSIFYAQVEEVCSFNLRNVEFLTNLESVKVSPNPFSSQTKFEFEIPVDDEGELSIIDHLGNKFCLISKIVLKRGTNSLFFENNSLPNGNYFLILVARQFTLKSKFVITK